MSHTDARSDLADRISSAVDSLNRTRRTLGFNRDDQVHLAMLVYRHRDEIVSALRLAASQPDREALAKWLFNRFMRGHAQWDNTADPHKEDWLRDADAILSLLSGAGSGADTKSDGGCNCSWGCVEADNCRRKLGPLPDWKQDQSETSRIKPRPSDPSPGPVKPAPIADSSEAGRGGDHEAIYAAAEEYISAHDLMSVAMKDGVNVQGALSAFVAADEQLRSIAALSAPVGEPVAWADSEGRERPIDAEAMTLLRQNPTTESYWSRFNIPLYTHPPAPAVGPDVGRRVLDILNAVAPAVENLVGHQEQCDMDGVMVKVSRQALDEVLNAVNEVALVSALTRPLGGFVQGSIADGGQCNEQSAPQPSLPPDVTDALKAVARPIATAPRDASEVFLISFQEQTDGLIYISAHNGCWSESEGQFVLGPRGSMANSVGDGVSTHWIPVDALTSIISKEPAR